MLKAAGLLGLSLVVVALLVRYLGGAHELLDALKRARPAGLVAALATLWAAISAAALRWRFVLSAMGYAITQTRALSIVLATMPFSIVAPSRANDLLRAHVLRREVPAFATASSVLAERAIDVQVLCVLACVGALIIGEGLVAAVAAGIAVVEWLAIAIALRAASVLERIPRFEKHRTKLAQLRAAFSTLAKNPAALSPVLAASLLAWSLNVALLQALLYAFDAGVGFLDALAFWPIALFVGLVPVSLGGLGTRDAAFLYLVKEFGRGHESQSAIVAATLGYAFASTWLLAAVGLPFAFRFFSGASRADSPGERG